MAFILKKDLGAEILEILGLDPDITAEVTVTFKPRDVVIADVKMFPRDGEEIKRVLKGYRWEEEG